MDFKKRVVIVSGTPGTGKTTVARRLASALGLDYVDVNDVVESYGLAERYDARRRCNVVDTAKLNKALRQIIDDSARGVVIDSHLSHYMKPEDVDVCVITKCDLKILQQRLVKRGYHDDKVRENLDAEILDICYNEAVEAGHDVIALSTDEEPDLSEIIRKVKS